MATTTIALHKQSIEVNKFIKKIWSKQSNWSKHPLKFMIAIDPYRSIPISDLVDFCFRANWRPCPICQFPAARRSVAQPPWVPVSALELGSPTRLLCKVKPLVPPPGSPFILHDSEILLHLSIYSPWLSPIFIHQNGWLVDSNPFWITVLHQIHWAALADRSFEPRPNATPVSLGTWEQLGWTWPCYMV